MRLDMHDYQIKTEDVDSFNPLLHSCVYLSIKYSTFLWKAKGSIAISLLLWYAGLKTPLSNMGIKQRLDSYA